MKDKFSKRVFSPASLAEIAAEIVKDAPTLPGTFSSGRVSPAFRERILLAVTSVNQCRYCQWLHTDLAAANGMSAGDIAALMGSDTKQVPEDEKQALVYAIHYAETNRQPDASQRRALVKTYGEAKARDIENYIRLIFFSNLSGNTFDSLLSRLRGEPSAEGNAAFEVFFAVFAAPVLLAIAATAKTAVNPVQSLAHSG
jgi:AhpD family alkylhydroperoxidase